MRKSKPVMIAAGLIGAMIALIYAQNPDPFYHHTAEIMIRHNLLEYAELFLFLLAAMTFINTMGERGLFDALRSWLVNDARHGSRTMATCHPDGRGCCYGPSSRNLYILRALEVDMGNCPRLCRQYRHALMVKY
jgi:hypothetical protein